MRYSNELKVGLAIIIAAIIFILGIRFFQDIPLFSGTYELQTRFTDAQGLIAGSAVNVSGVRVGAVEEVQLTPEMNAVLVRFHVDSGVDIPEGSYTQVSGIQALGGVRMEVVAGPVTNPPIEPGSLVPSREESVLSGLTDRAPALLNQLDSLMASTNVFVGGLSAAQVNSTMRQADAAFAEIGSTVDQVGGQASATVNELNRLLQDSNSDLRLTLASLREATTSLNTMVAGERERIGRILLQVEGFSGSLNQLATDNQDTLAAAIQNLNSVLVRLDRSLATLDTTGVALDRIINKIDQGEGTVGLMINDPRLYNELVNTATTMNAVLQDLQANPGRYLRELRLVDIF